MKATLQAEGTPWQWTARSRGPAARHHSAAQHSARGDSRRALLRLLVQMQDVVRHDAVLGALDRHLDGLAPHCNEDILHLHTFKRVRCSARSPQNCRAGRRCLLKCCMACMGAGDENYPCCSAMPELRPAAQMLWGPVLLTPAAGEVLQSCTLLCLRGEGGSMRRACLEALAGGTDAVGAAACSSAG